MRLKFNLKSIFAIIAAVLIMPFMAMAATSNPSPGSPGYMVMPVHISGQYAASTTAVMKLKLPFPAAVVPCIGNGQGPPAERLLL